LSFENLEIFGTIGVLWQITIFDGVVRNLVSFTILNNVWFLDKIFLRDDFFQKNIYERIPSLELVNFRITDLVNMILTVIRRWNRLALFDFDGEK